MTTSGSRVENVPQPRWFASLLVGVHVSVHAAACGGDGGRTATDEVIEDAIIADDLDASTLDSDDLDGAPEDFGQDIEERPDGAEDAAVAADSTPDAGLPDSTPDSDAGTDDAVADDVVDTDTSSDTTDTVDDADTTAVVGPCDGLEPLTLPDVWFEPFQFGTIAARGGSGVYRYTFAAENLGAVMSADFGTFLAGRNTGVVAVRVTDTVCDTSFDATVHIVEPLELLPREADIEPETGSLQFIAQGGSGQFDLSHTQSNGAVATATLSPEGLLAAGNIAETVRVRARDRLTGRERSATVRVAAGARFRIEPAHLVLPLGESWRVQLAGGSRSVAVAFDAGGGLDDGGHPTDTSIVAWNDGLVQALRPGRAHLELTDRHTGETLDFEIDVVTAPALEMYPAGDSKLRGSARIFDLDDDGHPEALIGFGEADFGANDSGGLLVYRGIPGGFETDPAVILTSPGRFDELGGDMALGDIDNDGYVDIAIGVLLSDVGGADRGHVQIHRGRPGDFFDPTPHLLISGENDNDRFGSAVGLCDVNDDGMLDLIATARLAEDENGTPLIANVGAIHVFLGNPDGFLWKANQVIFGTETLADGSVATVPGMNLGAALATGDVDGDGVCDVAVTAPDWGWPLPGTTNRRSSDGAVLVYRGQAAGEGGPGGLGARPALFLKADDPEFGGGQFGFSVALGDVDGDGLDDVLVGEPEVGRFAAGALRVSTGAATLWRGADIPAVGTRVASVLEAPWRYSGRAGQSESADRFGYAVAIGDFDGQGPLDVFVAARLDEQAPRCASNCGTVHALAAVAGGLPATDGPALVYSGRFANQEYGTIFAVAPDFDGDGRAELLVRAAGENHRAARLGRNLVQRSTLCPEGAGAEPGCSDDVTLEFPAISSGSRYGSAFATPGDLDGDGFPELAVGGWRGQFNPAPDAPFRPGEIAIYRGLPGGVSSEPFQRLGGFSGHSAEDMFGAAMAPIARINTTGAKGLLAVARADDATIAQCGAARSNAGAAYLFVADGAGGLEREPRAVFWGPQPSQNVQTVVAADINGDGFDDVVLGGPLWDHGDTTTDNAGGFAVYFGTSTMAATATVVHHCTPSATYLGGAAGDGLGTAMASLGDVNGDGCEDLAVGALNGDPLGVLNAGFVYLFWGHGGASCAFATPHVTVMSPGNLNALAGAALAAGDIDGDGRSELAIGGRGWREGNETFGAVWLVPGTWLRDLAGPGFARPWENGVPPTSISNVYRPNAQLARLRGTRRNEDFGAAVSIVGAGSSGAWLAVGRPLADLGGVDGAGAVSVYDVTLAGETFAIAATPALAIGGESTNIRADFGRSVMGWRTPAGRVVAVGAPLSRALGLDDGAFFVSPPR